MVIPAKPAPVVPCKIGNGNSPPARKLASFPDSVIKFGSARICSTLFCSSAWMVAAKSMSGRKMKRLSRLLKPMSEPVPLVPPVEGLTSCGGENCCVEMMPMFFAPGRLKILMPSWVSSVRFTSANFTSSRISPVGVAGISIRLVTFGAAAFTTSRILSATAAEDTRPDRITMSREVSTCTGSDGKTS